MAVKAIATLLTDGTINGTPVVVIGSAQSMDLMTRAVELGVAGFVPESNLSAKLPKTLRRIVKRLSKQLSS